MISRMIRNAALKTIVLNIIRSNKNPDITVRSKEKCLNYS
jgi:hypothetical protein